MLTLTDQGRELTQLIRITWRACTTITCPASPDEFAS
jgi:hypothetical protein